MFPFSKQRLLPRYHNIPYTALADQPTPQRRLVNWILKIVTVVFLIISVIAVVCLLRNPRLGHLQQPAVPIPSIPEEFRVVGLVFYGRRSRVEILDCYLKQNLKRNGGLLDEVIFLARTDVVEDLEYLERLVEETEGYTRHNVTESGGRASKVTYGQAWEVVERETMYVKIDDDVTFIEKNAIASLIATKVAHPVRPSPPVHPEEVLGATLLIAPKEYLLVSTNTINSPRLAWLHAHLSAIHPFLPESSVGQPPLPSNHDWRPSLLPYWSGSPLTSSFPKHPPPPSPSSSQRWLPIPAPYNTSLKGTPASLLQYEDSTEGLINWAIAAQEHYSFLQNLERDELWRYGGGQGGERLWNMQGTRVQINMIAIWGDDVVDNRPVPADDERYFTVDLVKRLGRADDKRTIDAVVDMNALAVHFAFRHQRKGIESTDLLERYKGVSKEYGMCKE
ncbi:MAG: hypothetical protein Q9220_006307 [cf. Caloplaca sp. 1 TL-2023]